MTTYVFLSGAVTFGFIVAALYFLRFWKQTHDGLFLAFAGCTVGLTLSLEITVARYFAGLVLDPALSLFPFTFDFVFIRI